MAVSNIKIDEYRKLRKRRGRFISMIIALLLALAITIGAVSYYGEHVGNFVIMVEKETAMSLTLCEQRDFKNPTTVLTPAGVSDQTNVSFFDLPLDLENYEEYTDIHGNHFYPFQTAPGGDHSDRQFKTYFAYTFYLKNTSRVAEKVDYDITLSLRRTEKDVDEAIRIMIIRNRDVHGTEGNRFIYAKRDRDEDGNRIGGDAHVTDAKSQKLEYESTPFIDNANVGLIHIKDFPAQQIDDFTVVMWLEGDDPDCVDAIKGGRITLDMQFAIVS